MTVRQEIFQKKKNQFMKIIEKGTFEYVLYKIKSVPFKSGGYVLVWKQI